MKKRKSKAKATQKQALPDDLAGAIERKALEDLFRRQARGKKLTGADYAFIERIKKTAQPETEKPSGNVVQLRPMTYFQKLAALQDKAINTLAELMDSGKATARAQAAKMLLDKGRQEAPPQAEKITIRFNPIGDEAQA